MNRPPLDSEWQLPPPQGRFGAVRKFDVHTGVDLYCEPGATVLALENGLVVDIIDFTGPEAGSPWWNATKAILVEGQMGCILYGEVSASVVVGQRVQAGEAIGEVVTVLKKNKGLPMTMLHLELYPNGWRTAVEWPLGEPKPDVLHDPTALLLLPCADSSCTRSLCPLT